MIGTRGQYLVEFRAKSTSGENILVLQSDLLCRARDYSYLKTGIDSEPDLFDGATFEHCKLCDQLYNQQ